MGAMPAADPDGTSPRYHLVDAIETGVRVLELDRRRSMFYRALMQQHRRPLLGSPSGAYYEFGVGMGRSLLSYCHALSSFQRMCRIDATKYQIFGFDTFEGLPESYDPRDHNPHWWPGKFLVSEESLRRRALRALPRRFHQGLHLVKGRFEETLTPGLREQLLGFPPAIVNIDCDYYTSCKVALDWLSPMLRTGTILYFDDVWEFWGHPDFGEPAAIRAFERSGRGQLIPFTGIPTPPWGRAYVFIDRSAAPGAGNSSEGPPATQQPPQESSLRR